jgi:hypothetical protein
MAYNLIMNKELEEAQTFFTNVVVNVIEKMRQEFV